jgi:predicted transcriptional regulator
MSLPSAKQAQAFWLHAAGMNHKQISEMLGCTPAAAQQHVFQAQKKATKIGLCYTVKQPEPENPEPVVGSGMLRLKELAKEAGLIK